MINKTVLAFCLLNLFARSLAGQELSLQFGMSKAFMGDLKSARSAVITDAGVNMNVTSDFPFYWSYGGLLTFRIRDNIRLGVIASTTSTGSRATYADYSGWIRFDQALRNLALGPHFQIQLKDTQPFEIWLYAEEGIAFTRYKMDYDYRAPDEFRSRHAVFNSVNFFGEAGLTGQYRLSSVLKIFLSVGFQITSGGEMDYHSDDALLYGYDEDMSTDWSGPRLNLGVTLGRFNGRQSP